MAYHGLGMESLHDEEATPPPKAESDARMRLLCMYIEYVLTLHHAKA